MTGFDAVRLLGQQRLDEMVYGDFEEDSLSLFLAGSFDFIVSHDLAQYFGDFFNGPYHKILALLSLEGEAYVYLGHFYWSPFSIDLCVPPLDDSFVPYPALDEHWSLNSRGILHLTSKSPCYLLRKEHLLMHPFHHFFTDSVLAQ